MLTAGIKLICFDLNKTLIKENTWFNLNLAMGVTKQEDEVFLNLYKQGILKYKEGQRILEKIYKSRGKATLENIKKAVFNYTYRSGVSDVIPFLKKEGYKLAILSGSVDMLVDKVGEELGIELREAANKFKFNMDKDLTSIICYGDESIVKVRHLKLFCEKLGIGFDQCACVGDGDNDDKLFEKTGHGITFRGSKIEDKAWRVIDKLEELKRIF